MELRQAIDEKHELKPQASQTSEEELEYMESEGKQ